ncbi:hypothetical protein GQ55_7G019500 [Panicum hallii var. hallii]|uniref:Protein kinase domain-containing protein n=1 Tax=Panicum hallii var. hallii TaxID=1504633 RepID=A0A2T7CRW0_9POAL|nr:hypothetical protein GQ55_7G019500 [Panicum hallii var. hallii]
MPAPLGGLTSCILIAVVQCLVAAIPPASGSDSPNEVISLSFPSFKRPQYYPNTLQFSWDAGILDGALHLTTDDVYQPPVQYAPDPKRSSGYVSLSRPLSFNSKSSDELLLKEASFSTTFTMSFIRSLHNTAVEPDNDSGLLLEMLPYRWGGGLDRAIYFSLAGKTSSNISVEIGKLEYYYDQGKFALYVSISPPAPTPNAPPAKYTVWIDYDAKRHNISVYVDDHGNPKPGQAMLHAPLNVSDIIASHSSGSSFGLFASKNRLLPSCQPVVYSWNLTLDSVYFTPTTGIRHQIGWYFVRVLPVVLAAAAAAMAFAVACCCLASRYRALTMKLKLSKAMRRLPGIPREFRYADVKKATRSFHESMRLGSGGFGAVYKGAMIATCDGDDGRQRLQYVEVAVKKFTRKEDRSYEDFLAEVAVINRLRHKNIVPLLGWCYENGELLLIYQYMPNGSLDQHLFHNNRRQQHLHWETRYNIIKDVAAGLHYVHHEYEHAVLHRDIKASNIMLDAGFHGRLGDFGLARVVAFDKNSFTDLGVAGTWGFIAPEYAVSHKATRQTDVYAFGVLILEVVTEKRSLGMADSTFPLLLDWVWWLHGEGRLLEAMDDEVAGTGEFDSNDATRLLLLGLACCNPNPSDRPSMVEVVQVISKSMPPPAMPLTKPAFVWPPEGHQLPLSDDSGDDEFVEADHRDSDGTNWEESECYDGLTTTGGIRSSEITKRKSRNVNERNITRDIENGL